MKDRFKFRFWDKDLKAYMRCVNLDKVFDDKTVIVEQCTGLKDKNGTLIYEGDIVKYYIYDVDKFNPVLRVNYTELLMRFDLVSEDGKYQSTYLEPCFNAKLEVIGNIHERKKSKEPCGNYSKCNNAEGCDNCAEYDTWLRELETNEMKHLSSKKCKNCGAIMYHNDLDNSWLFCPECGYQEEDK